MDNKNKRGKGQAKIKDLTPKKVTEAAVRGGAHPVRYEPKSNRVDAGVQFRYDLKPQKDG